MSRSKKIELNLVDFTTALSLGSEKDQFGQLPGITSGIAGAHNADRRRVARRRDRLTTRTQGRQRATWKRASGARRTFIEQLYRFEEASYHSGGPQSQQSRLEKFTISGSSGALACADASHRIIGLPASSHLVCNHARHDVHKDPGPVNVLTRTLSYHEGRERTKHSLRRGQRPDEASVSRVVLPTSPAEVTMNAVCLGSCRHT